jgi:hypothetical protein
LVTGITAFVFPHLFEFFMVHHGETLSMRDHSAEDKVTHMVIRIYGALIIGQFWIVWSARKITDSLARRALVQAYTLVFTLTCLGLLYGQLTASPGEGLNNFNWINIGMFGFLALYYFYFCVFEPITVFESLDKSLI